MESETSVAKKTAVDLKREWNTIKEQESKLRTRQIAGRLGVTEAELVASACDNKDFVRLQSDWEGIFENLESLGEVMALTRNEAAVHEKTGVYRNVSFKGHAGLVLDEKIDLRVFYKRWGFAFALPVQNPRGTLYSLQFFDKEGHAVHKIYLKNESGLAAYRKLIDRFRHEDQSPGIDITESIKKPKNKPLDQIDGEAFLNAWSELKDTHDFFPMLRKFKVGRLDALELVKETYTWQVSNSSTNTMLETASERQVPIMAFVPSSGMIQIHSGPVKNIRVTGDWLNVLDADFNLHLRQDLFHSTWIVVKPTEEGTVTALEIYDAKGDQIVTFFGARKPGRPELESWREIVAELRKNHAFDRGKA